MSHVTDDGVAVAVTALTPSLAVAEYACQAALSTHKKVGIFTNVIANARPADPGAEPAFIAGRGSFATARAAS
jgi:hypothetical protein